MKAALVACEDGQVQDAAVEALRRAGLEPQTASGASTLDWLRRRAWDIVLLGWELGEDVGGLEALAEAKRLLPQVPVLVLSPYPDASYARRAVSLGAFDYIEGPFTQDRLREAIAAAMPEAVAEDPRLSQPVFHYEVTGENGVSRLI